jgi:sulfite exporter TauE/SafE
MMDEALKLFVLGITVSFGPCVAHCSLVILPYIATTAQDWKGGLKAVVTFSLVRLVVYGALGLLAGLVGQAVIGQLLEFERYIMVAGGALVVALGLYTVLRTREVSPCRDGACQLAPRASIRGSALLGLVAGALPCLPLLGVLTFTALHAQGLWEGGFYGLAFGSGKLFSPLIVLGVLAGGAPALLSRYGKVWGYFTKLCGIVLIVIGASLIHPGLLPRW